MFAGVTADWIPDSSWLQASLRHRDAEAAADAGDSGPIGQPAVPLARVSAGHRLQRSVVRQSQLHRRHSHVSIQHYTRQPRQLVTRGRRGGRQEVMTSSQTHIERVLLIHCSARAGLMRWLCWMAYLTTPRHTIYLQCESKKIPPPLRTCGTFSKTVGNLQPNVTCLLCVPIYTTLRIIIQFTATLTKLCHIKRDHPVHIMCAKCPPSVETHVGIFWHFPKTVRNF